jgi:L-fuconolactonase
MARPVVDDAGSLFALAKYSNLVLKLTTHNVRDAPRTFLAEVIGTFGARRIAWGSNYPASEGALKAFLAEARAALPKAEHEQIFSRTAMSLYP